MKGLKPGLVAAIMLSTIICASLSYGHFGVIIPSDEIVAGSESKEISLSVKFMHPMESVYLEMAKPKKFGVFHKGKSEDLTGSLVSAKAQGPCEGGSCTYWTTKYTIKHPGDYIFFVEPEPYWEPAEDKYIVHYTKVWVNALGMEEGWDANLNLPIEIIPLTRPYGLWTGNVFRGLVLVNGKPAPNLDVEVEYMNGSEGEKVAPPADPYITQVVKTDANGVFTYAMPKAGWWGFAALTEAPWKLKHDGQEKDVEIGGVVWVHVIDMK